MKKVLITFPVNAKNLKQLNQILPTDCLSGEKDLYEDTLKRIGDYEGILIGGITKIDNTLIDRGTNLKIISKYGVGYDEIDIIYAKEKGIIVANTPNAVTEPTADLAMGLLLSLCRRIVVSDRAIRNKSLRQWYNPQLPAMLPRNKVLGIVGMGRIGKAMAKRAIPFGMKIAYHQRTQLTPALEKEYQATYLSLNELCEKADIISLHTPLNASTYHLIGKKQLALMKPNAFLVNTARGSVVDEAALIEVLQNQKIAGAALDVFANEPTIPDAFLELENVILVPHIGTGSKEAREDMFQEAMGNLVAFFNGEKVENQVN